MTNIPIPKSRINDRNAFYEEAGIKRSKYILSSIDVNVEVVSLSIPRKKGFFKKKIQKVDSNIIYFLPTSFNFFKLKYFSIMISILWHLLFNIKKQDVILCYNANVMYVLPAIILKLIKKNKLVYEIEELYSDTGVLKGIRRIIMTVTEAIMLKYADAYIIANETTRKRINNNRPILLNFGYDTTPKNIKYTFSNENIILYSGRLDYERGVELFLDALELINFKAKAIITGSGPLIEYVKQKKITNNNIELQILGFVDNNYLERIMKTATICVNPLRISSHFSHYSFPSKVLLYLSYGSTVVSSKTRGIMPLLGSFPNLHIYEKDSADEIARTIEKALSSQNNKVENIKNINNFLKKQKKELLEFWEKIL
jgi:glycosyltransferase involved in cell wall biosynthesis